MSFAVLRSQFLIVRTSTKCAFAVIAICYAMNRRGERAKDGKIKNGICSRLCRRKKSNGLGKFDPESFFFSSTAIV